LYSESRSQFAQSIWQTHAFFPSASLKRVIPPSVAADRLQAASHFGIERINRKAERVRTMRVAHVSSTFYGGGVTELLTPLTLLMNAMGIETDWHLVQGTPSFFASTKKLHNSLQGERLEFSETECTVYEQVVFENATRLHLDDCDAVIVHDPQPLPLISHFSDREVPWLWQCHVDLSSPFAPVWQYLRGFVEQYDGVFSLPEYARDIAVNQHFVSPAIKNGPASEGSSASRATRLKSKGKRAREIPDEPSLGGLARSLDPI